MDPFLQAAIDEAKKGLAAGGIPISSVLTLTFDFRDRFGYHISA